MSSSDTTANPTSPAIPFTPLGRREVEGLCPSRHAILPLITTRTPKPPDPSDLASPHRALAQDSAPPPHTPAEFPYRELKHFYTSVRRRAQCAAWTAGGLYVAVIAAVTYEYGRESVERSQNAVGKLDCRRAAYRISRGLKQCGFGVCSQRTNSLPASRGLVAGLTPPCYIRRGLYDL
jgi:hypothetical protein